MLRIRRINQDSTTARTAFGIVALGLLLALAASSPAFAKGGGEGEAFIHEHHDDEIPPLTADPDGCHTKAGDDPPLTATWLDAILQILSRIPGID